VTPCDVGARPRWPGSVLVTVRAPAELGQAERLGGRCEGLDLVVGDVCALILFHLPTSSVDLDHADNADGWRPYGAPEVTGEVRVLLPAVIRTRRLTPLTGPISPSTSCPARMRRADPYVMRVDAKEKVRLAVCSLMVLG